VKCLLMTHGVLLILFSGGLMAKADSTVGGSVNGQLTPEPPVLTSPNSFESTTFVDVSTPFGGVSEDEPRSRR
jgi:hypothetical protein